MFYCFCQQERCDNVVFFQAPNDTLLTLRRARKFLERVVYNPLLSLDVQISRPFTMFRHFLKELVERNS